MRAAAQQRLEWLSLSVEAAARGGLWEVATAAALRLHGAACADAGVDLGDWLADNPLRCWADPGAKAHLRRSCAAATDPVRTQADLNTADAGGWCAECTDTTPELFEPLERWAPELLELRARLDQPDSDPLCAARWAAARATIAASECRHIAPLATYAARLRDDAARSAGDGTPAERDAALRWCATRATELPEHPALAAAAAHAGWQAWADDRTGARTSADALADRVADGLGERPAETGALGHVPLEGLDL